MAQFRFAFRFSDWYVLSPQPYTRTVPVLGRTVATLRPALERMPWRSAGQFTYTLNRPEIVKQFPGPSLSKLMAQFRFAFRFSYWCMLSPQPYTSQILPLWERLLQGFLVKPQLLG